jgi:hypothetical protein
VLGNLVQRNSVVLLPVDDPADWEIPAMGSVTFTGSDGTLIEIDTDDTAARAYRAAWERRRETLKAVANRLNIILMPIRTDQEIHLSLIHSLEQRARPKRLQRPLPKPSNFTLPTSNFQAMTRHPNSATSTSRWATPGGRRRRAGGCCCWRWSAWPAAVALRPALAAVRADSDGHPRHLALGGGASCADCAAPGKQRR